MNNTMLAICLALLDTPDWKAEMPKSFMLRVKITRPELLTEERENYHPRQQNIRLAEIWVLRALFVHAEKIGLYSLPL